MPNKAQTLITQINRVQRTRKTMRKRMRREDEILAEAKKVLRDLGIRPYHKRPKPEKELEIST